MPSRADLVMGLLWLHLVASPLLFSLHTTDLFELNKAALAWLAAALLAGLVRWPGRWDGASAGVLLMLASAALSTLAAPHLRTALVGAEGSFGGLVTTASLAVLYFAARDAAGTPERARFFLLATLLAAVPCTAYAWVQILGWDPVPWTERDAAGHLVRATGTLGHPILLGGYLAAVLPLVLSLGRRPANLAVAAAALGALLFTLSRGAWLGCAAGLLALVLLLRTRRAVGWALLAAALAGLVLLAHPLVRERLHGVASRVRTGASDLPVRLTYWRVGLQTFAEHPLLGVGPDGFGAAFERRRPADYWRKEWGLTPIKAHNAALEILVTQGIVGAAALLVLAWGGVGAAREAWRRASPEDRPLVAGLVSCGASLVVQWGLVFSTVTSASLFLTCLAALSRLSSGVPSGDPAPSRRSLDLLLVASTGFVAALAVHNLPAAPAARAGLVIALAQGVGVLWVRGLWSPVPPAGRPPALRPAQALPSLVLFLGAAWLVGRFWTADRLSREGQVRLAPARVAEAIALDPGRAAHSHALGEVCQKLARQSSGRTRENRYLEGMRALERAVRLDGGRAIHWMNLGRMRAEMGVQAGILMPRGQVLGPVAEALRLDPGNPVNAVQAARIAALVDEDEVAWRYAADAAEAWPDYGPLQAEMAFLEARRGEVAAAAERLERALRMPWTGMERDRPRAEAGLAELRAAR